jgi:hypothetical protein
MQLVADPLDLLTDIQVGTVKIDQIPGQAEDFALAQTHDEDQDEGGIQGLAGSAGVLEEPAGFIDTPPAPPAFAGGRQFDHGGDVATDDFLINGTGERGPERVTNVITASRGKNRLAALSGRVATAFTFGPGGVFSLRATLADPAELIEPLPDVSNLEFV